MVEKKKQVREYLKTGVLLVLGSFIVAIALEIFLIPNNIIDGGILGIALMASYLSKLPLGMFIAVLNLPFLYIGYTRIGKSFAIATLFSIALLSIWVTIFNEMPGFTRDLFLATVFGGILLGLGVGMIIRSGGSLDGTEIIAIIGDKRTAFSVGEIVMFFNIFILGSAGLVYSWDRAMYSIVTYFIAAKVIDITIEGFDTSKAVIIISQHPSKVSFALLHEMGRGVTILKGNGGYTGEEKQVLYSIVTRFEISKLKSTVNEIDPNAFITISDVHDVMGGKMMRKKRKGH